ncbi:MAG: 50S ribosomal protein L15 [Rhodospirillaceae bacterium]|nr:50S ribosomal protein L15 [Rhodospirillaceae bacterium]
MKLNQLSDNQGATKNRKRIGRGIGSGTGKTGGRGVKGQKSRSGVSLLGFEGGQMPLFRRLPKRGFNNIFRKKYAEINIGRLQKAVDAGTINAKELVDQKSLRASGLIKGSVDGIRILAKGELKTKLNIEADGASTAAIEAVKKAGGELTVKVKAVEPAKTGKRTERRIAAAEKRAARFAK